MKRHVPTVGAEPGNARHSFEGIHAVTPVRRDRQGVPLELPSVITTGSTGLVHFKGLQLGEYVFDGHQLTRGDQVIWRES
jgi:hypothetical protein